MSGRFHSHSTPSTISPDTEKVVRWSRLLGPVRSPRRLVRCVACHDGLDRSSNILGGELCRACLERSHSKVAEQDIGGES